MTQRLAAIGCAAPRNWLLRPVFTLFAATSFQQAGRAKGCVLAQTQARDGVFFSLTVWEGPAAMKRFATSAAHGRAMRLARWYAKVSSFHHFACDAPPSWEAALDEWHAAHVPEGAAPRDILR